MKSLLLVLALVSGNMFSQIDPNVTFLNKALSEGDAITVGTFFDNTIELTLLDKQTMLKKDAAVTALKDFFLKNKPRSFNAVHQGSSKGSASHYTIGDLTTTLGSYRVYVYYKSADEKIVIQEMRIEK